MPYTTSIATGELSDTNNPMTIAENMLKSDMSRVKYIRVNANTGYTNYAPAPYSVYEIRQAISTVTINVISYQDGVIYTNAKVRNNDWVGWKKATMTAV